LANELYEVIIRNETEQKDTPIATSPNVDGESGVASPIKKTTTGSDGRNANALASAMVATNYIKPYIQQAVSVGISQIEMSTGASEMQRKMEAMSSIGSSVGGIVAAGVAGGIGAAGVATAMLLVQKVIETEINRMNIKNQKIYERENLSLAKSRAGMVTNRSRDGGTV
jgi:hypothetical protein